MKSIAISGFTPQSTEKQVCESIQSDEEISWFVSNLYIHVLSKGGIWQLIYKPYVYLSLTHL